MEKTDGTAAGRGIEDCSRTRDGKSGRHFGTKGEKLPRVKRAECVEREVVAEEAPPELYLVFSEIALRLVSREGRKNVWNIIRLVFEGSSDADELRRHVKGVQNYERMLDDSTEEELGTQSFLKETARSGSGSSVHGSMLYKKDVVVVLPGQMEMSSSQDLFISTQDVPEGTRHPAGMLHGQKTQRTVRKRVMASRTSDV